MKKKKGFTLIELVAVLVILAILALIVTPLVLNIIRKARTSADKRSIDAYGRSIEIAIANYLLDNGKIPSSIENLKVEYKGDEVICSKRTLNEDGSIYLKECTVGGRSVDYIYGKKSENSDEPLTPVYKAYSVGDEVVYNNVNYYVIKDSTASEDLVTLLKAEPLSPEEVQLYSRKTETEIFNNNGYGGMQYHSESNEYETSYIKTTIELWAQDKVPTGLKEVRLIKYDDFTNLGYIDAQESQSYIGLLPTENTPSWVYNTKYWYWTMSPYSNSEYLIWYVNYDGHIESRPVYDYPGSGVRPVIVLSKTVL